jgi:hypothetical protein
VRAKLVETLELIVALQNLITPSELAVLLIHHTEINANFGA